jgi:transposase
MPEWSRWLRLPHIEAGAAELVANEQGRTVEVRVKCRTAGKVTLPRLPCCLGPMLLKNGTKTIQVRDRRVEPVPTWLHIQRQRFKCKTCGNCLNHRINDDFSLRMYNVIGQVDGR